MTIHQPSGQLPSTRDRLLLAFANLASYGIAAHPALASDSLTTRIALHAEILARHPRATGSYIFWTAQDDQAFGPDGELRQPLTLHHSGADVARATDAALAAVGLSTDGGLRRSTSTVAVGDRSRTTLSSEETASRG